jgi:lipopolysaccharide export system protein LptA
MISKMNIQIFLFFILIYSALNADDKLHIKADNLIQKKTDRGIVRILEGNVFAYQEDAQLFCRYATWYVDQHETILQYNVKMDDGNKVIYADKVFYYDSTRITRAIGHVVIIDSLHNLKADSAIYYDNEERIVAHKNVIMTDDENQVTLTGRNAEYLRNEEYAIVTGDPVLIKKDSTGQEEIRVLGSKMELFKGSERALISDSVKIHHKSGRAKCDQAEYFQKDKKVILRGNPIVWQKQDKLAGQEIELVFDRNKLQSVKVMKQAWVTSPADTNNLNNNRINKLTGDEITILLENDAIKQVLVKGQATSYYHIYEKNEYKGMNKIIGDNITMLLTKGEIQKIIVESNPGASSGIFYPPGKFVADSEN